MLDPATKATTQVTFSANESIWHPASDGKRVVFEDGPRIAVYDPATKQTNTLSIRLQSDRIHARPFEHPIAGGQVVDLGPSGKRVIVLARGQVVTVPSGEGAMRVVMDDSKQRTVGASWSPDGKSIALVSDASGEEQIHLADPTGVAPIRQLTHDLKGEHTPPMWAPDSKHILVGDKESSVHLIDAVTGAVKTISHSEYGSSYDGFDSDFAFSPDGKWVALSVNGPRFISQVVLYEIATGKSTLVTDPTINSSSESFSPDGKYLYFLQNRDVSLGDRDGSGMISHKFQQKLTAVALAAATGSPFTVKNEEESEPEKKPDPVDPKNMKVEVDGIADRVFDLKAPAGAYVGLVAAGSRILVLAPTGLLAYDVASKAMTPLSPGVTSVTVSGDGKKLLVTGPAGNQVVDVGTGPFAPTQGLVKLAGFTVTIDPVAEWKQIFEESWRVGRDFFYDPNMHGVNWKAVRTKYDAQVPLVGDRSDLTRVISNMVAELNTGHCYVIGPSPYTQRAGRAASLGCDLTWDAVGGAYRITRILRGDAWALDNRSPLADVGVGVHEGDYLLQIGSQKLTHDQNPDALLVGRAGQTITITTSSTPTMTGARTYPIVPIPIDIGLRLKEWIRGRQAYVAKMSGGQLGYVYLGDMTALGANQFAEMYYPNVDKPGLIVDVRGNGGGNISGNILNRLSSKITGYFTFRSGGNFRREGWAPQGRVAAVTDEWAFSDGEYFSEYFKRMKIGPLVGHRTGGGEVGSGQGYGLVDGGLIYIPNYGAWTGNEWIVEGRGAIPDYEVDQDPAAVMAGRDPQLDKAIQLLMDDLKKHPYQGPKHPPYPVKTGGSRGGG